ncbi:MAG: hypothetical protein LF885_00115 [Rickettsia endosymbiont of Culicoides impunctatus]|nr:MAG: hypothetical protein LF885_00115 [Rickettsia endosymbiont of Culicoides impunctatus]
MSKTQNENNDSVDSDSITFKIEGLINRLNRLQKIGDIAIVNTPLDNYSDALKEYNALKYKATHTKQFSSPADKAAFLSDLNKCQAIIAFRAGQDASTYLKAWEKNTSTNADDFMTGLQTILEGRIKFLQENGNITKFNEPLDSSEYKSSRSIYDSLVKTIKDYSLSDKIKTKLSFDLNKCQAISAVRVGKKEDVLKYLLDMRTADRLNTDKFILELEPSAKKYAEMKKNGQIVNDEYLELYSYLQETVRTKVESHLKNKKYTEAYNETMYLREKGNSLKVFKLYLNCIEEDDSFESLQNKADAYIKAFNEFKLKISSSQIPEGNKTISGMYKDLQTALQNISDKIVFTKNTENTKSADYILKNNCNTLAAEAGTLAEQYTPKQKQEEAQEKAQVSPTVTLTPAQQKVQKELKVLEKAKVKLGAKLVNTQAKAEVINVETQFNTELEAATAKLTAELAAQKNQQLAQIEDEKTKQLATLHDQGPYKASAPLLSDLPPYESVVTNPVSNKPVSNSNLYPDPFKVAADIAAIETAAAEVLKTTILENVKEFITSSKTDTMKQIIVDCDNAIKKGINVYETVNDVKTLEVLASGFLSLNNQEKAEEICGKIATISPEAYSGIRDNKVLSLLAKKYSELELYNSCIESCKNLRATSEENYQLLKTIAEKTTDTDIQLAALTAAKSKTDNLKQQAELFLSKGKILLSLGKKEQASNEFGEAAAYNHDIYKDVAEETLKSLYESGNHEVGYWYLSKTHNFNHKNPSIAKKLVEFSHYVNLVHGVQGEVACFIKAYLCAPNAAALVKVQNDLSIMTSIPYAADYYKNYCAARDTAQIETYLQGIVPVIDEHM